jgi:hypothetical protein
MWSISSDTSIWCLKMTLSCKPAAPHPSSRSTHPSQVLQLRLQPGHLRAAVLQPPLQSLPLLLTLCQGSHSRLATLHSGCSARCMALNLRLQLVHLRLLALLGLHTTPA